jgi:hypothetical protein
LLTEPGCTEITNQGTRYCDLAAILTYSGEAATLWCSRVIRRG